MRVWRGAGRRGRRALVWLSLILNNVGGESSCKASGIKTKNPCWAVLLFSPLFCLESYGLRASVGSCELANELTLAGQSTRTKGSKICVISRNPFEGLKYLLLVVHVGFI